LEPINHITPKLARVKLEAMGFMRAQKGPILVKPHSQGFYQA